MPRVIFCGWAALAVLTGCSAEVTKLPAGQRKMLQDSSRFHEIRATADLPPSVVALCADNHGKLADPGQKWEATDVIMDDTLSRKRLVWAATDGEHYVVHYESGGRGHGFHVLVATFKNGDAMPTEIWHGVGGQLQDYAAFLGALQAGKLDDRLDYAH